MSEMMARSSLPTSSMTHEKETFLDIFNTIPSKVKPCQLPTETFPLTRNYVKS